MVIGSIVNFFERSNIECFLVQNTKWEAPLWKRQKFSEEYKNKIKYKVIVEDIFRDLKGKQLATTPVNGDVLDALMIMRYGANDIRRQLI